MHEPGTPVQGWTPVTVPIWPINLDGSCSCGNARCKAAGKHPRWRQGPIEGGGYGVLTGAAGPNGSGIFVVDCDVKPGIDGAANFDELCRAHGMPSVPDTLIVETGGGGLHFYFRHPGFPVANSVGKLAKGVDVKGDPTSGADGFAFVVGPGSRHPRGAYRVLHVPSHGCIIDAPGWLLDWPGLRKDLQPQAVNANKYAFAPPAWMLIDPASEEGQRRIACYVSECRGETGDLAPSVEGNKGSNPMFRAACRGVLDYLLPPATVIYILQTEYNKRCFPAWEEKDIRHKVDDAYQNRDRKILTGPIPANFGQELARLAVAEGGPAPGVNGIAPRLSDPDHVYAMNVGDVIATGKLASKSASEIVFQMRRHPQWIGVLQYDLFSESIVAVNPPIRLDCEGKGTSKGLSHHDITAVKIWFEVALDANVSRETLGPCIEVAAKACEVHSVRDYLYRLPAGDPGVFVGLAARMFGVSEQGGLDDEILKRFLVGAVRRALKPGTKMDTMLVLYGQQGAKKSTWGKALFGEDFYAEQMPDLSKGTDASYSIATVWAQEFPELDKLLKADPATVKDFLSRTVDKYRPPYARDFVHKPRQAVLIGTTNEREFLRDPTGERRSWIIEIPQRYKINPQAIAAMRDEVWAAALALALNESVPHWFDEGDAWDLLLKARQENYTSDLLEDGWTHAVKAYLLGKAQVTTPDIFRDVIAKGDAGWLSKFQRREQVRLGGILRAIGAKRVRANVYNVPDELAKAEARPFASLGVAYGNLSVIQGGRVAAP